MPEVWQGIALVMAALVIALGACSDDDGPGQQDALVGEDGGGLDAGGDAGGGPDAAVDAGGVYAGGPDVDDDGDGFSENDGDCDDTDPLVNPDQTEVAGNGVDDDCDGLSFGAEQSLGTQGQQLDVTREAGGDLHLVYSRNSSQVLYRHRSGGTWDPAELEVPVNGTFYTPRARTTAAGPGNLAQVAVADDGTVLIVFANGGSASEVYYFFRKPGDTWSAEPLPIAFVDGDNDGVNDALPQNYPVVVSQGNTFHVLWSDGRGAIYHRAIESVP